MEEGAARQGGKGLWSSHYSVCVLDLIVVSEPLCVWARICVLE